MFVWVCNVWLLLRVALSLQRLPSIFVDDDERDQCGSTKKTFQQKNEGHI